MERLACQMGDKNDNLQAFLTMNEWEKREAEVQEERKQASGNYEKEPFKKKASEMKTSEHGHSFAFLVVSYFFMLCVCISCVLRG